MSEHIGRSITDFYLNVAYPNLYFPPDCIVHRNGSELSMATHELGDTRLAAIQNNGYTSRYMRFYGLASDIPDNERQLLNFPPFSKSEDLVVACPEITSSTEFQIVPSEAIHNSRKRSQALGISRSETPAFLQFMMETRWVTVSSNRHRGGIYRYTNLSAPNHIEEISGSLPKTTEACLSVAQLLVMRDVELFLT